MDQQTLQQPVPEPDLQRAHDMSARRVDAVLAGLVDASVDAARVFHLAACCCRCYLLAVSLDRRALDHEAHAQVLRRLRKGAAAVRRGGTAGAALGCLRLHALSALGLLGEAGLARACVDAERRLLARQDASCEAGLPPSVSRIVRRQHDSARRSLQGMGAPSIVVPMRSA